MIKVQFDHQTFSLQRYGGISRYFANLHYAMQSNPDTESKISILYSNNHYLEQQPGLLGNKIGKILLRKQRKIQKWNERYSSYIINNNDFDILHPTYYNPYFLEKLKKPFVLTVHDMIHERFPSYFSSGDVSSYNKRKCIEKASHIIAISEATKTDIQYYHNIPPERITVIYHGFEYTQTVADQYAVDHEPYLLYVGDREGYKNFSTFLLAVAPILKNQPNMKLICAGGGEFRSAERELILRLGIESSLSQCNVDDKELADLYTNAIAFIYPSLSEGFGLPLLEAFKAKCPVIASDIPCFREVGDSALCYFDPYNVNHMSTVIQQVIADKELQLSLKISGEERLSKFSIDDCIDNTIKLYQSLV